MRFQGTLLEWDAGFREHGAIPPWMKTARALPTTTRSASAIAPSIVVWLSNAVGRGQPLPAWVHRSTASLSAMDAELLIRELAREEWV